MVFLWSQYWVHASSWGGGCCLLYEMGKRQDLGYLFGSGQFLLFRSNINSDGFILHNFSSSFHLAEEFCTHRLCKTAELWHTPAAYYHTGSCSPQGKGSHVQVNMAMQQVFCTGIIFSCINPTRQGGIHWAGKLMSKTGRKEIFSGNLYITSV